MTDKMVIAVAYAVSIAVLHRRTDGKLHPVGLLLWPVFAVAATVAVVLDELCIRVGLRRRYRTHDSKIYEEYSND